MADAAKLGKIFIGGLSYETTDEKLRSYFGAYGSVTDAVVMKDPISRRSRGFGFITYADPACVDRALAQPNHILDSRRVEAKRAVPRAESSRESIGSSSSRGNVSSIPSISINSNVGATKKIFVGGLHYETKDADFKKYFMHYGKVVSAEVMFNRETNKSRGFGFVIFETEDSVELVLQEKNHVIDGKSVEVKRAVPRTDVPPPRSVSSRGGSFSGTTGPGSVGSLDDLSISPTSASLLPGTASNNDISISGRSTPRRSLGSTPPPSVMVNGALGGYAAAVRYGRGLPKSGPASMSENDDITHRKDSISSEKMSASGMADALSSLVLGDANVSPPASTRSSIASSDKLLDVVTPGNGHMSPLEVHGSPLVNDPVIEQWNLSPAAPPQPSADIPLLSPHDSAYGLGSETNGSRLTWQSNSWQPSWAGHQAHHHQGSSSSQESLMDLNPSSAPSTPSFFSVFANPRGPSSPSSSATWNPSGYTAPSSSPNTGFGMMGMGMGLPMEGGRGFGRGGLSNGSPMSRGVFGNGARNGLGIRSSSNGSSYGSLGGFLQPEYLPEHDSGLPVDSVRFGMMGSEDAVLEKHDPLVFDRPATANSVDFERNYR